MSNLGGGSKYILLAEDNPADVQLVREALEDRAVACNLHVVADGEQAIAFLSIRFQRIGLLNLDGLLLPRPPAQGEHG